MEDNIFHKRVEKLRELMKTEDIDMYLILSDDFHASEYVGEYFKCREYISGFDGSAGTLIITEDEAGLWTDGRYFIQARQQLAGTGIELYRQGEEGVPAIYDFIGSHLEDGKTLGYDGRTVVASAAGRIKKALKGKNITFKEDVDLVGKMWDKRPPFPSGPIWILEDKYTGSSRSEKLTALRKQISRKADAILIASLDDIAWLYNIRGGDIAYTPVAMAYTIISQDEAVLYVDGKAVSEDIAEQLSKDNIMIRPYFDVYKDVKNFKENGRLFIDLSSVNVALFGAIPDDVTKVSGTNPTKLLKAVKTPQEIENERCAHIQDGVAVTKIIFWLKQQQRTREFLEGNITELTVAEKLLEFRKERPDFVGESFAAIIASAEHGAIVHYEPDSKTDKPIENDNFVLMDTGGHYLQGTTDVTRTVSIGKLNEEQKRHYTTVLMGNLNLADAYFKYGCTGENLDYLARNPLWEMGLDYNHGTGHGVGYLLNVHEGPNAIRLKSANGNVGAVLEEGMITSNEPGLYIEGKYGIRLENLMLCKKDKKTDYGQFMKFETLTMVPFDRDAIFPQMLTDRQREVLNAYHKEVYERLSPYLTVDERVWLEWETAQI